MNLEKKPTLEDARKARDHLLRTGNPILNGVGITVKDGVIGLMVNVSKDRNRRAIPAAVKGVPVHKVKLVKSIRALSKKNAG